MPRQQNAKSGREMTSTTARKRQSLKSTSPKTDTGKALRDRILEIAQTIDKIESEIVREVRETTASALRSGGAFFTDAGAGVEEVVRGTMAAANQTPSGLLTMVKAMAKGIVLGVADVGGDVVAAVFVVMRTVVQMAVTVGADAQVLAWRSLSGAVEAGNQIGGNIAGLVASAVRGALAGGQLIGTRTIATIEGGLTSVMEGFKEALEPSSTVRPEVVKKTTVRATLTPRKTVTARKVQRGEKQSAEFAEIDTGRRKAGLTKQKTASRSAASAPRKKGAKQTAAKGARYASQKTSKTHTKGRRATKI